VCHCSRLQWKEFARCPGRLCSPPEPNLARNCNTMPALLSSANRNYNQIRRIHPQDSASKLEYYRSSEFSSNLSASAKSSGADQDSGSDSSAKWASSGANSAYYGSTLSRMLGQRGSKTERGLAGRGAPKVGALNSLAECPYASSTLSGSTLAEQTASEHFERPAYQVQLEEPNLRSLKSYPIQQSPNQSLGSRILKNKPLGGKGSIQVQGINQSRLKRRNLGRINRRMLVNGDQLSNAYALSELFSQSEIPGFREIFASDSYLRKFCWIVAFLFMTILSLNDMTELITEYYEYPITVDVRLRDSARLPFPSVTVCNLNVVRFTALCNQGSGSDLSGQIPSELRDRLCGSQLDKKSNSSDSSDLSDINNIGISQAPTITSPASGPPQSTASVPPAAAATTSTSSANAQPATKPSSAGKPAPETRRPGEQAGNEQTKTKPPTTQATVTGREQTQSNSDEAEHRATSPLVTQATAESSTQRRSTAGGGLDLGDFVDPSMLVMGRETPARPGGQRARGQRSIRLSDHDESNGDTRAHPFASRRSRLRVWPLTGERSPGESTQRPHLLQQQQQHRRHSSQMSGLQVAQASRPQLSPGQQAPHATRNVNPSAVSVNAFQNPLLNNFATQTQTTTATPTTPMAQLSSTIFSPPALPEDFELTERQERELQENLTNWLAVMYNRDPQLTRSLGHQFDDMILRCTMKSINCTRQQSFENSFSPTEGNCFTYRSKVKRRPASSTGGGGGGGGGSSSVYEEANLAGTNHGLELVLNLEKNEYISGSSQVGALVMIHHPSDLGYAASEATFVAPEFTTYIGLKMINITRLPAPYPEYCVDSWPAKFAESSTRNSTYSQQACLKLCLQKTIQSHCDCQSAFLPIVELEQARQGARGGTATNKSSLGLADALDETTEPRIIICDTRKLATRQCVREVMFRAADRVHNCECPPKCQVVRYDKTISMARWPTREDKVTFDRGKTDLNFQNLAKVIVYFQTMTCEEVSQQAVFNAAKLFSALGGIMGMYVGFSFLSVFEIFEVMSRKMWHHFKVKLSNAMGNKFRD